MNTENNQPAFPQTEWVTHYKEDGQEGMTLLDYFAAKALQSLIPHLSYSPYNVLPDAVTAEEVAKLSYDVADAMLKEHNKRHAQ